MSVYKLDFEFHETLRIRLTLYFGRSACTASCTVDFSNSFLFHEFMKADLRISIKDYHRNKSLKVLLIRTPFSSRQFFVRMNGAAWPKDQRAVSLTRLMAALRKALVKAGG